MKDHGAAQTAIVTGSAMGIGRAIVLALAASGRRVIGADLHADTADELKRLAEQAGGAFEFIQGDVSRFADCRRIADFAAERFGPPDILVNNAGTSLPQVRIAEIEEADWRAVAGVTLEGPVFMSRAVLPAMIAAKRGSIVNIASMAGVVTPVTMGAYGIAKAGVIQLTKVTAVENVEHGIRANAILLGAAETTLSERARAALSAAFRNGAEAGERPSPAAPAKPRLGQIRPEDVAAVVVMLCSEAAAQVTSATIAVDQANAAGYMQSLYLEDVLLR